MKSHTTTEGQCPSLRSRFTKAAGKLLLATGLVTIGYALRYCQERGLQGLTQDTETLMTNAQRAYRQVLGMSESDAQQMMNENEQGFGSNQVILEYNRDQMVAFVKTLEVHLNAKGMTIDNLVDMANAAKGKNDYPPASARELIHAVKVAWKETAGDVPLIMKQRYRATSSPRNVSTDRIQGKLMPKPPYTEVVLDLASQTGDINDLVTAIPIVEFIAVGLANGDSSPGGNLAGPPIAPYVELLPDQAQTKARKDIALEKTQLPRVQKTDAIESSNKAPVRAQGRP